MASKKTTANEPVEAIDPGGTHPTKAGRGGSNVDSKNAPKQKVKSGDRNTKTHKEVD